MSRADRTWDVLHHEQSQVSSRATLLGMHARSDPSRNFFSIIFCSTMRLVSPSFRCSLGQETRALFWSGLVSASVRTTDFFYSSSANPALEIYRVSPECPHFRVKSNPALPFFNTNILPVCARGIKSALCTPLISCVARNDKAESHCYQTAKARSYRKCHKTKI